MMKAVKDYINLLPKEEAKPAGRGRKAVVYAVLFALAWGGVIGRQWKQAKDFKDQMRSLAFRKQALQQELEALYRDLGIAAPSGMDRNQTELISSLVRDRVLWSEVFREFSHIVPKGLWFDNLEGTAGPRPEIKIKGGAFNYLSVSEFLQALAQSAFFTSPQLLYAQKVTMQGRDVIGFEISCGVRAGREAR
jgi:Tfp pilus assembly protein PilN